jgi:pyruvate formate lyase activating enzyme
VDTPIDDAIQGRIFDIERYATHDGPGIRTTLFLKGCFLSCQWCHNPESISGQPELMFDESKCLLCLGCFAACQQGALYWVDQAGERIPHDRIPHFRAHREELGGRVYNADACLLCGSCVDACYPKALVMAGRMISVDQAVRELERDQAFYANSGGGITVTGGEPLYQPRFTRNLLAACQERGMHTALDTTLHSRWEVVAGAVEYADLVLLDLKQMDADKHKRYTGVDNGLILDNARQLARVMVQRDQAGAKDHERANTGVWVRVPVIPTINDDVPNMLATARFVRDEMRGAVRAVELLGYHQLGGAKSQRLGQEPPLRELQAPTRERLQELCSLWEQELNDEDVEVRAR